LAGTSGRNPDQKSVEEILAEMRQHYVPGAMEIPAAVGELVRLQNKGYRLVVNH
jgi:6,7-dimethyl-8-ribityllumazine synthase